MYNEISFLFKAKIKGQDDNGDNINIFPNYSPSNNNNNNNNNNDDEVANQNDSNKPVNVYVNFKDDKNKTNNDIVNFLNESSYKNNSGNPFVNLINDLEKTRNKSIQFGYKELAYLTDLGVFPVNRMVVLRRFSEGVEVPHNLNNLNMKDIHPISTIIGWINDEDDSMFNFNFKEKWISTSKYFWDQISEMVETDTGGKLSMGMSSPAWAQGFLFNFLNKAGYVDSKSYDEAVENNEIPVGDPDILKESSTREADEQGLESGFNINLKTSYEQKYINNIDPGSAFLDLIDNSLKMGTSDMKFFLGGKAKDLMNVLNTESDEYINSMSKSLIKLAEDFISTIGGMLPELDIKKSDLGFSQFYEDSKNIIKNGLNAALYRYRWPLRGSLGATTGQHTTPWHITLGHPLNPVVSMANVTLDRNEVTFNNEFGFNDLPTKLNLDITVSQSRALGKQEIMEVLNNAYGRDYKKNNNN